MLRQTTINELLLSPAGPHWKRIGIRDHHGIATPLFSLRSESGGGIGEYSDIKQLVDWCVKIGFDTIQLLPINDTGPEKSPYSALSSCALHPIYLNLNYFEDYIQFPQLVEIVEKLKKLNNEPRVNYEKVLNYKERFLKNYFTIQYKTLISDSSFVQFKEENSWLGVYSLFKILKERYQWQSWEFWNDAIRNIDEDGLKKLHIENTIEVEYHSFIQYHCFKQMESAKNYANARGIWIKGDIPILISRESADVWYFRHLFRIEMSAGAPPDMYSSDGQNWGFPIYDWTTIKSENYYWWKERLKIASRLYDIYRIDHVVGFYHIWAIPPNMKGKDGKHIPSNLEEQLRQGEEIMRMMLEASPMLPIGEDLGVVPQEVRANLKKLGICGTKVMRWEKRWNEDGSFIPVEEYTPVSMTTVSTHDSETLKIWWSNHYDEVRQFCQYKSWPFVYELKPEKHFEILYDSHHSGSLFHINLMMEYLSLVSPLNWSDFNEERINVPGKILEKNWTFRIKPTLSEILNNNELTNLIQSLLKTHDS